MEFAFVDALRNWFVCCHKWGAIVDTSTNQYAQVLDLVGLDVVRIRHEWPVIVDGYEPQMVHAWTDREPSLFVGAGGSRVSVVANALRLRGLVLDR